MAAQLDDDGRVEYHVVGGVRDSDALLASMAEGSVIINATGAGKDRPGSPLSDAAVFPEGAIAWDFNYRGDLGFLVQARRQLPAAQVHDGWRYFVFGWTQVIGEVFGIEMTAGRLAVLEAAAEPFRPGR
jgi:shikimate 5-dehydrogenase